MKFQNKAMMIMIMRMMMMKTNINKKESNHNLQKFNKRKN